MEHLPRRLHRRSVLADAVLAGAVVAAGLAEVWVPLASAVGDGSPLASSVVVVLLGGAVAPRRAHPSAVLVTVVVVATLAYALAPVHVLFWGGMVPIMLAVYTVARHEPPRRAWVLAALTAALLVAIELARPDLLDANDVAFRWVNVVVAFALGTVLRRTADAARRAALEARAAEESAERARFDERARIAREMHDVVAHSVSVMVVQAGAAQAALDADPAYSRDALTRIRETGAEALEDMRRVLAVLRDGASHEVLPPPPGLSRLPELVRDVDRAGPRTVLEVEGDPLALPAALDHTAYRIVQEALTNVRRHSDARHATVRVRYRATALEVEVVDDGHARGAPPVAGHGILGMRERVSLYEGVLDVGPGEQGFRVHAVLPLEGR
ncbi:MAG: histidine kinase [Actinomycetota bacterium]|nr:histidine kinase [Actinomycetota bacterium]